MSARPDRSNSPEPRPDPSSLISSYQTDPEMMELVEVFVGELPARIQALQSAWRDRQIVLLTRMAHQLKGCCAGYGFPVIGEAAATLEARLRMLDAVAMQDRLHLLQGEFQQLLNLCSRACRSERR